MNLNAIFLTVASQDLSIPIFLIMSYPHLRKNDIEAMSANASSIASMKLVLTTYYFNTLTFSSDFHILPSSIYDQRLQEPLRMAHHWGWRAIALTPRCTILKRKSCKRGSASTMFRGVPSGRFCPVQKIYWQDIIQRKYEFKMSTNLWGNSSAWPNDTVEIFWTWLLCP